MKYEVRGSVMEARGEEMGIDAIERERGENRE